MSSEPSPKIPISINKGPLAVFYPAIIEQVIRPAILSVIQQAPATSKGALWKSFRELTGASVCYPVFNQWLHDAGISFERAITVNINGSQPEPQAGSALAAIQGMVAGEGKQDA